MSTESQRAQPSSEPEVIVTRRGKVLGEEGAAERAAFFQQPVPATGQEWTPERVKGFFFFCDEYEHDRDPFTHLAFCINAALAEMHTQGWDDAIRSCGKQLAAEQRWKWESQEQIKTLVEALKVARAAEQSLRKTAQSNSELWYEEMIKVDKQLAAERKLRERVETNMRVFITKEHTPIVEKLRQQLLAAQADISSLSSITFTEVSTNLAEMITEYVKGGIKGGTDWTNGLPEIIAKRLKRLQTQNTKSDALAKVKQ